jgi:hypothetical protein
MKARAMGLRGRSSSVPLCPPPCAVLIQGVAMTSTTSGAVIGEESLREGSPMFDVVDSRPRASDRAGLAVYTFAKRLRSREAVKAVAYATEGKVHLLWTFIMRRQKDIRAQVYEEERRLMDEFPDLTFDFNVLSLDRFSSGPLLPDDMQGQFVYYRGEQQ